MLKGFLDRHGGKLSSNDSDMVMVTRVENTQSSQPAVKPVME